MRLDAGSGSDCVLGLGNMGVRENQIVYRNLPGIRIPVNIIGIVNNAVGIDRMLVRCVS